MTKTETLPGRQAKGQALGLGQCPGRASSSETVALHDRRVSSL